MRHSRSLCLVKVYNHRDYSTPACSYWESKRGAKTLSSLLFRYYRHKLSKYAYSAVDAPFVIWHNLYSTGDNHCRGTMITGMCFPSSSATVTPLEPFTKSQWPCRFIRRTAELRSPSLVPDTIGRQLAPESCPHGDPQLWSPHPTSLRHLYL
jgi:hypothetical protein